MTYPETKQLRANFEAVADVADEYKIDLATAEARLAAVRAVPMQPPSFPDNVRGNSYSRGWTDAILAVSAALAGVGTP